MHETIAQAAAAVIEGEVLVYPTETFYALGGVATNPQTARNVEAIKSRPPGKPFPLLVGSWELVRTVIEGFSPLEEQIARLFWPGPLSILLPGKKELPAQVKGSDGSVCVRWTSHPIASLLSRECGGPLIATSANVSAEPPACRPWELSPAVVGKVATVIEGHPWPSGGLASTIVRCEGREIRILRAGAISRERLEGYGLTITGADF